MSAIATECCPDGDTVCFYCGCCRHSDFYETSCKVLDSPLGMSCPEDGCGCEGTQ